MNNQLLSNEENERMALCIKLYHNAADLPQLRQLLTTTKRQKYARQARENHHVQLELLHTDNPARDVTSH